jgi:type II secretory pathway component GspD/PulD (secretin)
VPLLAPQQVQVRNGAKATLSLGKTIPVQWVQSVSTRNESLTASSGGSSAPSVSASSRGGRVQQAVTWLDASQNLTVQPRWPGGKLPVTLEVEVQSSSVEARTGAELPTQSRSQVVTTVSAPLGQWVTIASTGGSSAPRGVYGSEVAVETRRLLQLRVLAP